ncbi:hypothetical protein BH10BAC5_BH10BAC5_09240 [soil metagenome]
MKNSDKDKTDKKQPSESKDLPGYPEYPDSEDIFTHDKKVADITPDGEIEDISETISKQKEAPSLGDGLDVPGSEQDDDQEAKGSEDEENNYYSLGGDNHNDLEEDHTGE